MFLRVLKQKREELRNKNEGFTLVELIVVIVILAILIGVTIGGIYMYVGQSRTSTDTNNASAITSTLSTMAADQNIYDAAGKGDAVYHINWKNSISSSEIASKIEGTDASGSDGKNAIASYMSKVLTNGLPKAQSGNEFSLYIVLVQHDGSSDGSANVYVNCTANGEANPFATSVPTSASGD